MNCRLASPRIPKPRKTQATRRGVVYSIGPSRTNLDTLWAGTDDGFIHLTRDGGKTWKNVTPPTMTPWSKVSQLDASHFDDQTVYAAINRIRVDDQTPAHLSHARWRRDMEGDRARPARWPRQHGSRGPCA